MTTHHDLSSATRRAGVTAVHSVERVVFTVPEIEAAEKFYTAFGLRVKRDKQRIDL